MMLRILDLSKTCLTSVLNTPQEGEIGVKPYTKVPDHLCRREKIAKNVEWEKFFIFSHCFFD